MKNYCIYSTSIGKIGIADNGAAITNLDFCGDNVPQGMNLHETDLIRKAAAQLMEYLEGKRSTFDVPLAPEGTPFQKKVWDALRMIPYGETRSYGEIAGRIGQPKASRAVGMANNRNPIAIIVPCHRVIGANGKLVGYAGGLGVKEKLLVLEKTGLNR